MSLPTEVSTSIEVSAIVPARNEEENIAQAVESLSAQAPVGEIIVVNDESSDRTATILSSLAAHLPKLCLREAGKLADGWVGKNHAAWVGASAARGQWLLFTDADAVHLPGSTSQALADAARTGAALVSYSPRQEMRTWWERALVPFVFVRLAQKYRYAQINDPKSAAAAANGQYLLIRRDAYDRCGGHRAVASEVLEDVALAERVKSRGYGIFFAPGGAMARVRMYRTFGAMWQGWVKNLYPLMSAGNRPVSAEIVTVFPWLPIVLLLAWPLGWLFPAVGLALLAGRHAASAAMLRRSQFSMRGIQYYIPAVTLYCAALAASARRYAAGSVKWKGREYAVRAKN
jgi:cellulose synthase/poly-beta-1,6-N-acetylglucosamine synthase-like glycosyltransferase